MFVSYTLAVNEPAFRPERKIFRRRALLKAGEACCGDARTIDLSHADINLMVDRPLSIGTSASVTFNITVDRKTTLLEFSGRIGYCVLVGTEGYRVRLDVKGDSGATQPRQRLSGLMEWLA